MRRHVLMTTATALAMAASPFAVAQAQTNQSDQAGVSDKIDVALWSQQDLYDGWTVQQLFDTEVRGSENDEIGEIENLVIDADGNVTKVIIEAGGFLDIGDTHFAVDWDQVEIGPEMAWVEVPVDEDNVPEFSLFEGDEEVATGPRAWRASELLNDYVSLQDSPRYGIVDDIVIDRQGKVQAVVVYPDVTYGVGRPYAYPYYGYADDPAFDPGAESYDLPYTLSEVQELGPFDYSQFPAPLTDAGDREIELEQPDEQQG